MDDSPRGTAGLGSDADLRLLVSAIRDYAIFMLDPAGLVSSWNRGAKALKGYGAEEIVGRHFSVFYLEGDRASGLPAQLLQRALRDGRCEHEGWRLRRDGTRFWANAVITPMRDELGALVGFAKVTRDLTERKRIETDLTASAQVLRTMAEGVVLVRESDRIIVYANAKAEQTLGYATGKLQGTPMSVFYAPALGSPDELLLALDRQLGEHGTATYEARRLRSDGSEWWARVNVTRFEHPEHGPVLVFVFADISDRKQLEEDLKQAHARLEVRVRERTAELGRVEERYRQIVETTSQGVWVIGEDGITTFANGRLGRLLGYPPGQMLGRPFAEFFDESGRALANERWKERRAGREAQVESLMRRKDGSVVWVAATSSPIIDAEGKYGGVVSMLTDITERRAGDVARIRLAAIVQSSDDAIWSADMEGRITSWNLAAERLFGFTQTEAIGQHLSLLCAPDKIAEMQEMGKRLLRGEGYVHLETERLRKDKKPLSVALTATLILNAMGQKERCVIARDLTDRRRAEAALRESEHQLRQTLDNMLEGYTIIGSDWRYLYVNEAGARQAHLTKEEMVGRSPLDLFPGFEQSNLFTSLERCLKQRAPTRVEEELLHTDGSKVWFDLSVQPVPEGILVLSIDATERRRSETARGALEQQLRQAQKMEAVGRLAGGVAHDFNNILSVILSYAEVVQGDLPEGDPLREELEEIRKAGNRAAELTKQLLLFSRRQVVAPRIVDLNGLVANTERMTRRLLGEDVDLVFVPGPKLGNVRADPGNIEQVLMNLVVNARDAMPTGGRLTIETANVELDAEYSRTHLGVGSGPHVMLAVSDTGTGMDKATQAQIFEPFFTTKAQGKGTGLGLSTVFGIVQQHGGNIWVYSEPGQGTTFKIYLPRVDAIVEAPTTPPAAISLRGRETILLVEDEDQLRAIAHTLLKRNGYRVLVAENAGAALLLCEKYSEPIDLLLTDVVMPNMSGAELARRLAATRPEMKVLCMSGYTDDTIIRHGVIEGEIAFLQKPFTPDSLSLKVREVLGAPAGRYASGSLPPR